MSTDQPIDARVYPGADGRFLFYEDEYDNYNYERGEYATTLLEWDDARQKLNVGERKGHFNGMHPKTFRVVNGADGWRD